MSIRIPFNKLSDEVKEKISKTCSVRLPVTQYEPNPGSVFCFEVNKKAKEVVVPFGQWRLIYDKFPDTGFSFTSGSFTTSLYTKQTDPKKYRDQDIMMTEALSKLKENHYVFLELATGYGKTACATYITSHFRLKTLILCHLSTVGHEQWPKEIEKFTTGFKVQVVKGKTLDPTADIYIMGVLKASGMSKEVFKDIGLVIYDEAHIATPTACTKSLLKIHPRYIVGLSATPTDRDDGMQKLLYLYFGPRKEFIKRTEVKDFTVIKYKTKYKPKLEYTMVRGRMTINWNEVMNSMSANVDRQREIAQLAIRHPEHRILILSNRQDQCRGVHSILTESGEDSALLIGATKKWDKSCRILVAGMKKAGVGFDDSTLTMLIIASDVKSVKQYEGRIRTTNNLIYDMVDNFSTFERHWSEEREPWYRRRGATIVYENGDEDTGKENRPRFIGKI